MTSKRREIIHFLEDLTHRMKNQMLTDKEEQLITEFYLSHSYSHSIDNNNKDNLKKYLVMGWYVYKMKGEQ